MARITGEELGVSLLLMNATHRRRSVCGFAGLSVRSSASVGFQHTKASPEKEKVMNRLGRKGMKWERAAVFISSTFNDMHAERDYLVKNVFPKLRE
jgi:hypothetical protein